LRWRSFFKDKLTAEIEFGVEDFVSGFGSVDGETGVGDEADLFEDGGLVPVDVFMSELAVAELHDGDERDAHRFVGGLDVREDPRHELGVGEGEDHFVDDLVVADGARDWGDLGVGRHGGDEVFRVKTAKSFDAGASGEDGDVVNVSVGDHGGEGSFGVAGGEFIRDMLFPEGD